ncbi:MAG: DUF368 domain-containing protein [Polyangiales bacterium]
MKIVAQRIVGGLLMGLANLVPGISGGTMLLASGVYEDFVNAIADLTALRFKKTSILTLATIAVSAFAAILLFAGPVKDAVVHQRWIMYSLFIGLTLGGAPIIWRMAKPASASFFVSAAIGLLLMVAITFVKADGANDGRDGMLLLFFAGWRVRAQ